MQYRDANEFICEPREPSQAEAAAPKLLNETEVLSGFRRRDIIVIRQQILIIIPRTRERAIYTPAAEINRCERERERSGLLRSLCCCYCAAVLVCVQCARVCIIYTCVYPWITGEYTLIPLLYLLFVADCERPRAASADVHLRRLFSSLIPSSPSTIIIYSVYNNIRSTRTLWLISASLYYNNERSFMLLFCFLILSIFDEFLLGI